MSILDGFEIPSYTELRSNKTIHGRTNCTPSSCHHIFILHEALYNCSSDQHSFLDISFVLFATFEIMLSTIACGSFDAMYIQIPVLCVFVTVVYVSSSASRLGSHKT